MAGARPEDWEDALGALIAGRPASGPLAAQLAADPGVEVFRHLVAEFRASTVIGTLPFTGRLLLLALGTERFESLLADFWRIFPPEAFGSREALRFADHLRLLHLDVPLLAEVLDFDVAVLGSLTASTSHVVEFSRDPRAVLGALADHRLPEASPAGEFRVEVDPTGIRF